MRWEGEAMQLASREWVSSRDVHTDPLVSERPRVASFVALLGSGDLNFKDVDLRKKVQPNLSPACNLTCDAEDEANSQCSHIAREDLHSLCRCVDAALVKLGWRVYTRGFSDVVDCCGGVL